MSHIQASAFPARAPSVTSHVSAASGRETKSGSHLSNGSAPGDGYSPPNDYSTSYPDALAAQSHHTPQSHPGGPFPNANPSAFLPQVTASPPPHAPPYIPPPQHAMAPDPIHSMQMSMMMGGQGPGGMMSPPGMAWPNGPGWRPGPGGYPVQQPPYPRQNIPNGHVPGVQHQLPPNPLEAYPARSSMSMAGVPNGLSPGSTAMLQQAILNANGPGRPGSAHGEVRDRRRERERSQRDDERGEGERDSGRDEPEVITTIFVVGFPDDMGEREFQNMFTFSPGFEAATLKFPAGSTRREPAAALLAELTQLAASQNGLAEGHGEMAGPGLEEALAALQMGGTANTSSSTTPSAAMSLTPSAPSGPTFGGPILPQLSTRRQTIGFARFKARADAVAAKEHLQGRKIDSLTGATLKAEMAKKNLHTKRATSREELVGLLLRSGRLAGLMNAAGQQAMAASAMAGSGGLTGSIALPPGPLQQVVPSAREAWDSWPVQGGERDKGMEDPRSLPQSNNYPSAYPYPNTYPQPPTALPTSAQSSSSTSPPLSVKSQAQRPNDSKALLALAEEADELEGWSVGGAVGMGMGLDGFSSHPHAARPERERERSSGSGTLPLAISNMQQSGLNHGIGGYGRNDPVNYGSSPPGESDHMSDAGRSLGGAANPADQNPPINTLYVGNLPAISPPTHPPNFLEESLRSLFSRCQGFKRMSFRQKINGPMCFVEFEDVPFATRAIQDMYGHNLGGLVKGGIRLSYSKNSLGQRGSSHPSGINTSMFGGIAHTVALAGMSSPATSNPSPGGPGYGPQSQQGGMPTFQSAPIPMQRPGEGTSLSPTAQPFNATLPMATSPRSRYFGSSPPNSSKEHPGGYGFPPNSGSPSAMGAGPGGNPGSGSGGGGGGGGGGQGGGGQFSPVSSPIRTPASYSWVSSGGSNGYGFDSFAGHGMSLGGAASAWGQGGNGNGSGGPGQHQHQHQQHSHQQ